MKAPAEVDGALTRRVTAALAQVGLLPDAEQHAKTGERWPLRPRNRRAPGAVVAAWAARQVRLGRADARWLVDLLRSIDPASRSRTDGLDSFLDAIERSFTAADSSPDASAAQRHTDRLVWFLTLRDTDDDIESFPGLPRDEAHLHVVTAELEADIRRVTDVDFRLAVDASGRVTISDRQRSATRCIGRHVDPDRLLAETAAEDVDHALVDEAGEAAADEVVDVLRLWGTRPRCPTHGADLVLSWCEWVCSGRTAHTAGSRGGLRAIAATTRL